MQFVCKIIRHTIELISNIMYNNSINITCLETWSNPVKFHTPYSPLTKFCLESPVFMVNSDVLKCVTSTHDLD